MSPIEHGREETVAGMAGQGVEAGSGSGATCRVGTSGWNYPHWSGIFYPAGLRPGDWLAFYAGQFSTVEINVTHYNLPSEEAFRSWYRQTPSGFSFAVKASRYITHMKKLRDPVEPLSRLLQRARILGDKLGPILYQLPPRWHADPARLESFLEVLPTDLQHVFEFRHQSWLNQEVFSLLRRHNAALCLIAMPGFNSPVEVTSSLVYIRMHGQNVKYGDKFSAQELGRWASRVSGFLNSGLTVRVYFNNDARAFAVENARELRAMVRECG